MNMMSSMASSSSMRSGVGTWTLRTGAVDVISPSVGLSSFPYSEAAHLDTGQQYLLRGSGGRAKHQRRKGPEPVRCGPALESLVHQIRGNKTIFGVFDDVFVGN